MIKILFVRNEKAYLPEIDAYIKYFNKTNIFMAYDSSRLEIGYNINDFDIIWDFKGFGSLKVKDKILVHEYASLSTGIFPKIKNQLKVKLNDKPNLRVFLNDTIRNEFNFKDNTDYCIRDMGIDEIFISTKDEKKEYNFVYVGNICKIRKIDVFLNSIRDKSIGKVCLIGDVEDNIYAEYKNNKDIIFTGRVAYHEVPQIARKAIYGLNLIPDVYPYNLQTSTKLLEYLAMGLRVITTESKWINNFEHKNECSFYKIAIDNVDMSGIDNFNFKSNFNSTDFLWDKIIDESKIKEKVMKLCKES